jgi:hypothetical protein
MAHGFLIQALQRCGNHDDRVIFLNVDHIRMFTAGANNEDTTHVFCGEEEDPYILSETVDSFRQRTLMAGMITIPLSAR